MDIRTGSTLPGPGAQTITIERLLGSGGFGQVFLARLPDGTAAAVKTMLTGALDADGLAALQNEARLAVGIDHPNVVRVLHAHDGSTTAGLPPYLIMEYVDGGALQGVLDARRASGTRFTPDELRALYAQIAAGMAAVNARLVHRDLKPENVLVDAASGRLKVADFGLAKLVDAATRAGTFKGWGTPPYMAPEAFEGGPNTVAMDVYGAGVMFYELAALALPIQPRANDRGPLAWRNAHLLVPAPDLRAARPDLPPDLVQLVTQMLEKNPARRPAAFAAVAARLAQAGTPGPGAPDVTALVARATTTYQQASAAAVAAREARERAEERAAVLAQAFAEPVAVLRGLVETFNAASAVGRLRAASPEPGPAWEPAVLSFEVQSPARGSQLVLRGQIVDDLDVRGGGGFGGVARVLASARVSPVPSAPDMDTLIRDRESMSGFNLVYRVAAPGERFGAWTQVRFEKSPLASGGIEYPRWKAVELRDLPRELQIYRAMHVLQRDERPLDGEWFMQLLQHLV